VHPGEGTDRPDPAAARVAAEVRRLTIANILAAVVAAAEVRPAEHSTFASLIFETITHGGYHDAVADTVKRRGLERAKGEAPELALGAHARSLDARGLRALILELALARSHPRDARRGRERLAGPGGADPARSPAPGEARIGPSGT
jgi:hypothetical protein